MVGELEMITLDNRPDKLVLHTPRTGRPVRLNQQKGTHE